MESNQQFCDRVRENLNIIFMQLLREVESALGCIDLEQRHNIEQWLEKLRSSNCSIAEMRLRNEIICYMVGCKRRGSFYAQPFNYVPPKNVPLEELRFLLPPDYKTRCIREVSIKDATSEFRAAMSNLSDCGKFIYDQPVPRSGVFFIAYLRPTTPTSG